MKQKNVLPTLLFPTLSIPSVRFADNDDHIHFSPVGFLSLAGSQTARLSVVNVRAQPVDPCRAAHSFVNAQGPVPFGRSIIKPLCKPLF